MRPSHLLQPQAHLVENTDLRKRYKYLLRCKEAMWTRWTREYLRSLRERHASKRKDGCIAPHVGDVVIIKSEERNRGKWRLGIVTELIAGTDGVVYGRRDCAPGSRSSNALFSTSTPSSLHVIGKLPQHLNHYPRIQRRGPRGTLRSTQHGELLNCLLMNFSF